VWSTLARLVRDDLGLAVIGTSGRRIVAVDRFFSNPFVNWELRSRDRDRMQQLLDQGDWREFAMLAARYRLRYVANEGRFAVEAHLLRCLTPVWSMGNWTVRRVGQ
jgi:hypothetical protein